MKKNNISFDEFQDLKLKDINKLGSDEKTILENIRDSIKFDEGTRMKKVLLDEDALEYYINGSKDTRNHVKGFVSRVEDSKYLSHNYEDVVETSRLDYLINGTREFPDGGNCHWEIEFNVKSGTDLSKCKPPYDKAMPKGVKKVNPPCTGNGFTGGRNGTTIPEWETGVRAEIKDGATLNKYVDGKVVEQYKYIEDIGK